MVSDPGPDNASVSGLKPRDGDGEDKERIEFVATKPGTYFYVDGDNSADQSRARPAWSADRGAQKRLCGRQSQEEADALCAGGRVREHQGALQRSGRGTIDGKPARFPGKAWRPGREYIWIFNQIDPVLCRRIAAGENLSASEFQEKFHPRYFTINGLCGLELGARQGHLPDRACR